ncbi:MAG: acylneuraminate cytidylyltransferase, partial [Myxococcota bacterium]
LLDRHYQAAKELKPDAVVKIPSDCPLIDPGVIDGVLEHYHAHAEVFDFVSNLHPPSYPDGNDVEVMAWSSLETAWKEATKPHEREHTTPFIWDQPNRFRIGNMAWPNGRDLSMSHRFTIDYEEDYRFISAVYDELWTPSGPPFSLDAIIDLLEQRPDIMALNAQYAGVNWYRHHLNELKTVSTEDTRQLEV